jgi:ribonuclease P protein component
MANQRFPKRLRLLSAREFERVFAARKSAGDSWLVLYGDTNTVGRPRLGLTVPRRVGGAVQRNRWKRLLREAFRLIQHELPAIDYVCVPRSTPPPELRQLIESFPALAQRLVRKLQSRDVATQPAVLPPLGEPGSAAVESSRGASQ